jgi:ABC-type amino acid transport substrate-binding protein
MKFLATILVGLTCALAAPAEAQTLEKIRKSGAITMGYVDGSAPFAQLGLASLETRWVALTLQNRLEAVRAGKVDIECSTTTWTLERQKDVDFSLITFVDGGSMLTRMDAALGRLTDFEGKRIAVISGTTTEKVLKETIQRRGIKAQVVTVKTRDTGVQMLDSGKVDGFASDRIVLIGQVLKGKTQGAFKLLDEDFSVEPYALALPKGDHDYRLAVNRVLARLYRTGDIAKIYNPWLGRMGPPSLLLSAAYFIQGVPE